MMHSDSRVKEPVCLATTSLPDPCLSTYLSPRFREEPFFMFVRLQLVTILHNYIDNRNHYLYHFRPLRMKPLPVSAACTD